MIDSIKLFFRSLGRSYNLSLTESKTLAADFFGETSPSEVVLPAGRRATAGKFAAIKLDLTTSPERPVKILYTITRMGKLGQMYTQGVDFNTSDTTFTVAISRDKFFEKFKACGADFNCALNLLAQLETDCRSTRSKEDCWFCTEHGGGQDCSKL